MKVFSVTLVLLVLLLTSSYIESVEVASAFCDGKCKVRCSKAGKQSRCYRYCMICCGDCHCVPSGTYGNKDECPCYRDMVTTGPIKKPKCP